MTMTVDKIVIQKYHTVNDPNCEVAIVAAAVAAAMAVAGGSSHSQETKLKKRRGEPEKSQGSYRLQQIVNSAKHSSGRAWLLQRRHVLDSTHGDGQDNSRTVLVTNYITVALVSVL
ncbi:hypothetical protein U0070_016999 [Myodes glareolus]|uniref:Uncharacterized protein n=1 Tax=Myodes glareolus TaxID=447135 RepID=A0AAW0IGF8_MYOGA